MKRPKVRYPDPAPVGWKWIFVCFVTNPHTGQRVYPKTGKCFALLVPDTPSKNR